MKVLVVLAHPEPKSFCASMARVSIEALRAAGHTVEVSDLYAMGFDPVSGPKNFTALRDSSHFKQQSEEAYASAHGGFEPGLEAEMAKLEACALLIWHFPLWWFSVPAILKGWADRVLAAGRFYGGSKGIYGTATPLRGKKAILAFTTGGAASAYTPDGFNGDVDGILRPIHRGIFEFCGLTVLAPEIAYAPAHGDDTHRSALLKKWADRLAGIASEEGIVVGKYK